MAITVYVDGCGGDDPKYCFYVKESGKSYISKCRDVVNDKIPEYMALKSALEWLKAERAQNNDITIYSDVQSLVGHINHEFAINNDEIRSLVLEMWPMTNEFNSLKIEWISRKENLAGKILGS